MTAPPVSRAVDVVPATPDHLEAVRSLDGLGRSTLALLDRDLQRPDHRLVVALGPAGEVVGFGAVLVGAGEAHLLDVAVARARRRQGIGAKVVAHLRRVARDELGATSMTLEVRASNAPARALYRHLGFVDAGVRPGYYPDGGPADAPDGGREDAVVMWDHDLTVPA